MENTDSNAESSWFSQKESSYQSKVEFEAVNPPSWVTSKNVGSSSTNEDEDDQSDQNKRKTNTRLTKSMGKEIANEEGRIGGDYVPTKNPPFIKKRQDIYQTLSQKKNEELSSNHEIYPREKIEITLPNGSNVEGISWETTPLSIALGISKGLADNVVVAKVFYTRRVGNTIAVADSSGLDDADKGDGEGAQAAPEKGKGSQKIEGILWDLTRPLEGDCRLFLLKFEDPEAKAVFWHSSAHVLGECLECEFGCHLTVGPPVQQGFYYDSYMGKHTLDKAQEQEIDAKAKQICKEKQVFERIVLSKEEALLMFADNPYKVSIIKNKIKDGSFTTAYRCGPLIDLCMGPHIPDTGRIKSFMIERINSSYWLGKEGNDSLQRVYGISFPDKKLMDAYLEWKKKAIENDHRNRGSQQQLFFFDKLSPGSAFFEPHGARIYNALSEFIRKEYRKRGYQEVITPNMFNVDLWKISGHWKHYQENMFSFTDGEQLVNEKGDAERQIFALKPMNCPGHCLMFKHRSRSFRELPLRLADFGVLHRNEKSGTLTGLTRVRRFQQDDAHIFCRKDQIKQEVLGALRFMHFVYHDVFGMTYRLDRSTRPEKACGLETPEGVALWDLAEDQLREVLDEFVGPDNWRDNPGDGAFYGPKIDIKVYDVMGRQHQCATVQLDFQLPINFGLSYVTGSNTGDQSAADDADDAAAPSASAPSIDEQTSSASSNVLKPGYERPVMIHRAMLGSIERNMAILIEHYGGKYPFWLSPRQAIVVPLHNSQNAYAQKVASMLGEYYVDVEDSTKTYKKKIAAASVVGYNFILVVGRSEEESESVSIRGRSEVQHGVYSVETVRSWFKYLCDEKVSDEKIPKDATAPINRSAMLSQNSGNQNSYVIGSQVFQTKSKLLAGKRFGSLEEYSSYMNSLSKGGSN